MAQYESIPAPSFDGSVDTYAHREILASMARFEQDGGILAGGQGIVLAGTVLGWNTTAKKYYVYNNAGSGGVEVAVGVLRTSVDTGTGGSAQDMQVNILRSGIFKTAMLSGMDSAAITDLHARVDASKGWTII